MNAPIKLLCLSRYGRLGASSRLRFFQYFPYFQSLGYDVTTVPLLNDAYLKKKYANRFPLPEIMFGYWLRIMQFFRFYKYDLIWVEKELLPWLPTWVELCLLPKKAILVVDYDDAIFHQYDCHPNRIIRHLLKNKIDAVMHRANLVVAGNRYLADRAIQVGAKQVIIIPTVVDLTKYYKSELLQNEIISIGWMGSPATAQFLHTIGSVINAVVATKKVRFFAVGANADQVKGLPITVIPWTENSEVAEIQAFDIGIMPLPDMPFTRGKCGYKLIQYMACGKPVVASPVGANVEIVRNGVDGYWASSEEDWINALTKLIDDADLRKKMGDAGRESVEKTYALNVTGPILDSQFRSLLT